jgi:hypothetical protein
MFLSVLGLPSLVCFVFSLYRIWPLPYNPRKVRYKVAQGVWVYGLRASEFRRVLLRCGRTLALSWSRGSLGRRLALLDLTLWPSRAVCLHWPPPGEPSRGFSRLPWRWRHLAREANEWAWEPLRPWSRWRGFSPCVMLPTWLCRRSGHQCRALVRRGNSGEHPSVGCSAVQSMVEAKEFSPGT